MTVAGKAYLQSLTEWLQDTRLTSEAVYRLYREYSGPKKMTFSPPSWPKGKGGNLPFKEFSIGEPQLGSRMETLLKTLWSACFVFLETLWEEYLEELLKEIRVRDASIFEPFVDREFMAEVLRDALTDRLGSFDEIKDEVAARFAAGLTRQSWEQQWKQLRRLAIGLSDKEAELPWFQKLDIYFEMRNCIIHRNSRVSPSLKRKDSFYAKPGIDRVEIWPPQLDFFRHQFIACLLFMESCIAARFPEMLNAPGS